MQDPAGKVGKAPARRNPVVEKKVVVSLNAITFGARGATKRKRWARGRGGPGDRKIRGSDCTLSFGGRRRGRAAAAKG